MSPVLYKCASSQPMSPVLYKCAPSQPMSPVLYNCAPSQPMSPALYKCAPQGRLRYQESPRWRPPRYQVLPHSPEPCDCIILSFHAALSPALSNLCLLGDPWRHGARPDPLAIAGTSSWCQRLVFGGVTRRSQDLLQRIHRN
jgi:hypothetical protein